MPKNRDDLIDIARDALMNIAGVCGVAAKALRPTQALDADLGFGEAELNLLAKCLSTVSARGRAGDSSHRIAADELHELMVWQVVQLTLRRATGCMLGGEPVRALVAQAQAELRGARRV